MSTRRALRHRGLLLAVLFSATGLAAAQAPAVLTPDAPKTCDLCDTWNAPREPFRLFGNTYYVGVAGLSSLLVTSDQGHILMDGGLPQSAPRIFDNIRRLGFRTEDVKLILNSHAHYDHVGGLSALQRATKAAVIASPSSAKAMALGRPTDDDPQVGYGASQRFAPVAGVRVVADGETVRLGPLAVTAHFTPGHTPGSTAWTWKSCEGERCLNMVFADSLTAVAAPGFRYTGTASYPSRVDAFRRSIATVEALPCDIVVSTHPEFTDIDAKRARGSFIDPNGCRTYAATARQRLDARIADERTGKAEDR